MDTKFRYNFKDWLTGRIENEVKKGLIEEITLFRPGSLPYELYQSKLISEDDYRSIFNIQRKAFFQAIEQTSNALIRNFQLKISSSIDPDRLLSLKIEELEDRINSIKSHQLEKVLSKGFSDDGLNYFNVLLILSPETLIEAGKITEKPEIILLSPTSSIPDDSISSRAIGFYAKLGRKFLTSIFSQINKEKFEDEDEDEGLFSDEWDFVFPLLYDNSVIYRYYQGLVEIKNSKVELAEKRKSYPDGNKVAELFIEQSKNKQSEYTVDDYTFVMNFARDHSEEANVSELIRNIQNDDNCPNLVAKMEDTKAIRKWIKFYDKNAGIERK